MLTAQRKHEILERLRTRGQVLVAELAVEWGVSEDTIRRDLRELAEEGRVQRVHGGALPASPATGSYDQRQAISMDAKVRLARTAVSLLRPGQKIAVDGGTTNLELVRAFPRDLSCTVITHSPLIAAELQGFPLIEVIIVGGRLFRHSMVAVGAETADALRRFRTDLFFLGVTGVHPDHGATTGDWEDAAIKRTFCQQAAEVVILASPEKWGAASAFEIVPLSQVGTLVVDGVDPGTWGPYQDRGVTIATTRST